MERGQAPDLARIPARSRYRHAYEWYQRSRAIQYIPYTDVNTGKHRRIALELQYEMLAKAKLLDAFVQAANSLEPGLGDRFGAEASWPLRGAIPDARRRTLDTLMATLERRAHDIVEAIERSASAGQSKSWRRWALHPAVQEIETAEAAVYNARPGASQPPGVTSSMITLINEARLGYHLGDDLFAAMRPSADAYCPQ